MWCGKQKNVRKTKLAVHIEIGVAFFHGAEKKSRAYVRDEAYCMYRYRESIRNLRIPSRRCLIATEASGQSSILNHDGQRSDGSNLAGSTTGLNFQFREYCHDMGQNTYLISSCPFLTRSLILDTTNLSKGQI